MLPPNASGTSALRTSRLAGATPTDRKSTRLNSSHGYISYAVFCLKKKKKHRSIDQYTLNTKTKCANSAIYEYTDEKELDKRAVERKRTSHTTTHNTSSTNISPLAA